MAKKWVSEALQHAHVEDFYLFYSARCSTRTTIDSHSFTTPFSYKRLTNDENTKTTSIMVSTCSLVLYQYGLNLDDYRPTIGTIWKDNILSLLSISYYWWWSFSSINGKLFINNKTKELWFYIVPLQNKNQYLAPLSTTGYHHITSNSNGTRHIPCFHQRKKMIFS